MADKHNADGFDRATAERWLGYVRATLWPYFRPRVVGAEHLPKGRALIVGCHSGVVPYDAACGWYFSRIGISRSDSLQRMRPSQWYVNCSEPSSDEAHEREGGAAMKPKARSTVITALLAAGVTALILGRRDGRPVAVTRFGT